MTRLLLVITFAAMGPGDMAYTDEYLVYQNPVGKRYASREMLENFGAVKKFTTWRRLWSWLAKAQFELGLPGITAEIVGEMEENVDIIDFKFAEDQENIRRHDVMAHQDEFARRCPNAMKIIHLGATSCFVGDNTDLICLRDALDIILPKLARCIHHLANFADKYKSVACLGFTHLQPAQPVTVGKRACLWIRDLLSSLQDLERERSRISKSFRGCQGTTGTQASYLQLFNGEWAKVNELNEKVTKMAGFIGHEVVTGQTYSRKIDSDIIMQLANLAAGCKKFATDLRLLCTMKEVEEPFESTQVGSSAMAYKRNPMRSERICSLARFTINLVGNVLGTHSEQWLERTLDDSANRRITLSEAFLSIDSILIILQNVVQGMIVNEAVIRQNLDRELPFMATEAILMAMVGQGAGRNECHEKIRQLSVETGLRIKRDGLDNNLIDRIHSDEYFKPIHDQLDDIIDPSKFIGLSEHQVNDFIVLRVKPALEKYKQHLDTVAEVKV